LTGKKLKIGDAARKQKQVSAPVYLSIFQERISVKKRGENDRRPKAKRKLSRTNSNASFGCHSHLIMFPYVPFLLRQRATQTEHKEHYHTPILASAIP
jgi:hypothetical protein